ncbi:cytochrome P450 [Pilaira anomala]|nr:cytochrome P450 [Pilaira anomala]
MSTLTDNPFIRVFGISAAIVGAFAIKYPDRALFDEHRPNIPQKIGWPLVGMLPAIVNNSSKMHEMLLRGFSDSGALTTTASALGLPRSIVTIGPLNIEHILKHNFENYAKGPQLNRSMGDLFGHGIFNANGERWKYQRKTASHIFNVKNFRDHFTEVFLKELKRMFVVFDSAVESHETVDFHDIMFKFTLDSFVELGFGVSINAIESKEKVPFAASFDECQLNGFQRFINPLWEFTEPILFALQPWKTSMNQHLKIVDEFAYNIIESRRQQLARGETHHKDLLSRFMNAHNENNELLNNKELRDVVLNFIIAGRDTTAQALSWTFYMFLLHPRIEKALLEEIDQHITDDLVERPTDLYEVIKNMTYAHAVFYEVLRLFPSVPNNQKYALNDDIWPDGTEIRKGDYVIWAPWAQGRSEQVWGPDAKEFKPERWITPEGDLRRESQGQWPAFHVGPRVCLGQNLATLEALIAMVFILKRYKFSLLSGQNITYQISLTLPMKEGMKVYIAKR